MQTFLPYPDFQKSVECLDYRRLGNQRVEGRQLVNAVNSVGGWSNHPAVKMWKDHAPQLRLYTDFCIREWEKRGYKNNMTYEHNPVILDLCFENYRMPSWFGDEAFHASHRSNLLRKDPEYYGQFGWTESHDLEYVWPGR